MTKPNHKVKKANHGKRPANNKARKSQDKKDQNSLVFDRGLLFAAN